MSARLFIAAALGLSLGASAQNAQDELERQLSEMVGKPPTKLLLQYEGLDQPNYKLAEVSFELDGSTLPSPSLEKLNGDGQHLIFHGDVKPGKHKLEATIVLTDVAGALFSYEAGYKWKVKKEIAFEQQPGLEVHIVVIPELNPGEKDAKKKFTIKSTATVKMLAKVEDGTMPDSPKPNIAKEEPVDAGVVVAELSPAEKAKILKDQQAEEARLKKQQAIEDAKRKKEDAAAAKAAKLEEQKRKKEESAANKAAAIAEAKRKAQEAAEAKKAKAQQALADKKAAEAEKKQALADKKAADEEKKRQAAEAAVAAKQPKGETQVAAADNGTKSPVQPTEPAIGTPPPAEPPAAEIAADAGQAVAVVETPKTPQAAQPTPATEPDGSGLPWPIIIGAAVALLGLIIFIATRKKEQPPY